MNNIVSFSSLYPAAIPVTGIGGNTNRRIGCEKQDVAALLGNG
jgi:hypothetical protein